MANTDERTLPGLYLLWPRHRLENAPEAVVPAGYGVRTRSAGAEEQLHALLDVEGWRLSGADWKEYRSRLLVDGLYLLVDANGALVASAGAVHNPSPGRFHFPFGGELAYLIVHPEHRRKGLGRAAAALVVRRFLVGGYENIRVCAQGFRLPALRLYLELGFVPFLHQPDLAPRWERLCAELGWTYTPDRWPRTLA